MDEAKQELLDRARRIYDESIRPLVEKDHFGKVVSIDVDSGDYEIAQDGNDRVGAIHRLRARHENPSLIGLRIGIGPVGQIRGFQATRKAFE